MLPKSAAFETRRYSPYELSTGARVHPPDGPHLDSPATFSRSMLSCSTCPGCLPSAKTMAKGGRIFGWQQVSLFAIATGSVLFGSLGCRRAPEPESSTFRSESARASMAPASSSSVASPGLPLIERKPTVTPEANLLVAFIGDQGNGVDADRVLQLIKSEGAHAVVHNGDFDYVERPTDFEARINSILGPKYPYFAVVGNHDAPRWEGPFGYAHFVRSRLSRVPEMKCTGEPGVMANCRFRGLHLVESCVGTDELRPSCNKDSPEQVAFLRDSLAQSDAVWVICNWHKNQRDMQVGGKADEVGWQAYQQCQSAGALIMTGHEHSYARTRTLTRVGEELSAHGKTGEHASVSLAPGRTLAIVSGLGGVGFRSFASGLHDDDTWWSSYATSDRWVMHGQPQNGVADYGALFVRFHVDGDPKKATAYFKDVRGRVLDSFTLRTM
jgi:Calcineurin-like phosphoesterase